MPMSTQPLVFLIDNGLVLTVLLLGGHLVARGGMPARSLTAFYFFSQNISQAMQVTWCPPDARTRSI